MANGRLATTPPKRRKSSVADRLALGRRGAWRGCLDVWRLISPVATTSVGIGDEKDVADGTQATRLKIRAIAPMRCIFPVASGFTKASENVVAAPSRFIWNRSPPSRFNSNTGALAVSVS